MKLTRHQFLALFVGTVLAFTGCEHRQNSQVEQIALQKRLLPHSNPTSYEFDATASDIKNAIKKAFSDDWRIEEAKKNHGRVWTGGGDAKANRLLTMALQLPPGLLFWKGDADALTKGLLTKLGNENDAYFYATDSPVGESQVYFKGGQPLIYYADFHIHLTAVGSQKTSVEIFTYDSSVVTGVDESLLPHRPSFISVKVDPTTVEEYQILLRIGEQLGTKGMPPLVTPGTDAPVKELTLPRER
jgi:hypothetical protein